MTGQDDDLSGRNLAKEFEDGPGERGQPVEVHREPEEAVPEEPDPLPRVLRSSDVVGNQRLLGGVKAPHKTTGGPAVA